MYEGDGGRNGIGSEGQTEKARIQGEKTWKV